MLFSAATLKTPFLELASNDSISKALAQCVFKVEAGSGEIQSQMTELGQYLKTNGGGQNGLFNSRMEVVAPQTTKICLPSDMKGKPRRVHIPSLVAENVPDESPKTLKLWKSIETTPVYYNNGVSAALNEYLNKPNPHIPMALKHRLMDKPLVVASLPMNYIYRGTPLDLQCYLSGNLKVEELNKEREEIRQTFEQEFKETQNKLKKNEMVTRCAKEAASGSKYLAFDYYVLTDDGPVPFSEIMSVSNYAKVAKAMMNDEGAFVRWLGSLNSNNWFVERPTNYNISEELKSKYELPTINVDQVNRLLTIEANKVLADLCDQQGVKILLPGLEKNTEKSFCGYKEQADDIFEVLAPKTDELIKLEAAILKNSGVAEPSVKPVVQMFGPPGTGKTLIATEVQRRLGVPLILLNQENYESKMQGQGGRKLGFIFDLASSFAKIYRRPYSNELGSLVFADEIDSIVRERSKLNRDVHSARMINIVLKELGDKKRKYGFLAATNTLAQLDSAYMSRVTMYTELACPTHEDLFQIWKSHAQHLNEGELHTLADLCSHKKSRKNRPEQLALVGRDINQACTATENEHVAKLVRKERDSVAPLLEHYVNNVIIQRQKWVKNKTQKLDAYWDDETETKEDNTEALNAVMEAHSQRVEQGIVIPIEEEEEVEEEKAKVEEVNWEVEPPGYDEETGSDDAGNGSDSESESADNVESDDDAEKVEPATATAAFENVEAATADNVEPATATDASEAASATADNAATATATDASEAASVTAEIIVGTSEAASAEATDIIVGTSEAASAEATDIIVGTSEAASAEAVSSTSTANASTPRVHTGLSRGLRKCRNRGR